MICEAVVSQGAARRGRAGMRHRHPSVTCPAAAMPHPPQRARAAAGGSARLSLLKMLALPWAARGAVASSSLVGGKVG